MASSPKFKIYEDGTRYIGCMKDPENAAAMAAVLGDGTRIKYDHRLVIWEEGLEEIAAGDSYDRAAEIMWDRVAEDGYRTLNALASPHCDGEDNG